MKIQSRPYFVSTHKTGKLPASLPRDDITRRLGVDPEITPGQFEKVTCEWDFLVDGEPCAIWDYRGVKWSTYGPPYAFAQLFDGYVNTDSNP